MKLRYALTSSGTTKGRGRRANPDCWITGPDPVYRDIYYAWLKHRAQAKHRGEDYSLTWDQWQQFWNTTNWQKRGRSGDSLILGRINWDLGWHEDNVEIMTRKEHFKIRSEYNAKRKS